MKSTKKGCVLCDLPVEIAGFELETKDGQQHFCCAGCLSVYRLLNPKKILPQKDEKKNESL